MQLRSKALIEFMYGTGARISEAIQLNLEDIGTDTARFLGKGGKERIVPVGSEARRALDEYLVRTRPGLAKGSATRALFLNQRGDRLSRQGAWLLISDAAERAWTWVAMRARFRACTLLGRAPGPGLGSTPSQEG